MKSYDILYQLIRCSLGEELKIDIADAQIEEIMNLGIRQGVSLLAFDGFQKAYNNERNANSEFVKLQWIGQSIQFENTNKLIVTAQQQISDQLKQKGIKALVLKGSALSRYYKTPEFRQYGDIDIYSPTEFEKIDDILKSIGANYDLECYRHSHCLVQGITVENHIYLTDARWKKKWAALEDYLSKQAAKNLIEQEESGLGFPDYLFNILFFVYHALDHFVYDQLTLRFLVDWFYLLKGRKDLDEVILEKKLAEYGLMQFAVVLTVLCVKRLSMDENLVPKYMIDAARNINPSLLKKFEDDMFDESHSGFTTNSLKDRIARLSRFYQYRWKIEEFYGISLFQFVWSKVLAIIKWNQFK